MLGLSVLDAIAGRSARSYLARYGKSHSLKLPDALVAAAATTFGPSLWTLNHKHYPMPEVRLFGP